MPDLYVIGGSNGSGKTTVALKLLPSLGVLEYIAMAISLRTSAPSSFKTGTAQWRYSHRSKATDHVLTVLAMAISMPMRSQLAYRHSIQTQGQCKQDG
uniref:hypothetical protein n=1 Tax=Petrachloros mirabilis TaxID=2918835 RepID=UPI001EE7F00B|nr:hypothetical protein [Petrachloros mirabilis]